MSAFRLPAFAKFLLGAFLLQGATALLLLTAQDTDLHRSGWLLGSLGVLIGVIATLWFSAISSHECQHSYTRASEKFNRQRDRLRRQAEKEKTREIRDSQRQILRETRRLQSRSSLKLGAAMAGTAWAAHRIRIRVRARQYPAMGRSPDTTSGNLPGKSPGQERIVSGEKEVSSDKPG